LLVAGEQSSHFVIHFLQHISAELISHGAPYVVYLSTFSWNVFVSRTN